MSLRWRRILIYTLVPAIAGIGAMWMVLTNAGADRYLALWDASISIFLFVIGAKILANILRYYRPSEGKEWTLVAWIASINLAWLFGGIALILLVVPDDNELYEDIVTSSLMLRFFVAVVVLTCAALITWIRRQSESEARSQSHYNEIQKLYRETELNALRQQLQPHFLFNSLNSIQALTTSDPAKAKTMVLQLSDFLRGTLRKDNHAKHSLADEIENARLYLEIEKVRFGDRLQVDWKVDENFYQRQIPALMLQPLLENAVKYGVYQTIGPVTIQIQVWGNAENTVLEVGNPFDPEISSAAKGTGFGLSSLRRRLFLLFGQNDLVQAMSAGNMFIVQLRIPVS